MQDTKISRSLITEPSVFETGFWRVGGFLCKRIDDLRGPLRDRDVTGFPPRKSFATLRWTCWIMIFSSLTAAKGCVITCSHKAALRPEPRPVSRLGTFIEMISNGMRLLLIDGCSRAVVFSTQEMPQRSVGRPPGKGTCAVRRKPLPNCCATTCPSCGVSSVPGRW